nr:reverse transcriptase domain-containing protein [Tanacetum cinerariifolium]
MGIKGLMDEANDNILGMEIVMDQSGNTLRVSQSRVLQLFDRRLRTNVQVFVDFDYAMGRSTTVMGKSITRWVIREMDKGFLNRKSKDKNHVSDGSKSTGSSVSDLNAEIKSIDGKIKELNSGVIHLAIKECDVVGPSINMAKFGLKRVMLNHGFFFFQFDSSTGMEKVMEGGPWRIKLVPIILKVWMPNTILKRENVSIVPLWVKMHNVPIVVYSKIGLDLISAKVASKVWYLQKFRAFGGMCPMKLMECPKKKCVNESELSKGNGHVRVTGRKNKGKQVSNQRQIHGIRFTKPKTKLVYRVVEKSEFDKHVRDNMGMSSSDTTKMDTPLDSSRKVYHDDNINIDELRAFVVNKIEEEKVLDEVANINTHGCTPRQNEVGKVSFSKHSSSMEVLNADSDKDEDEVFPPDVGCSRPSSSFGDGHQLEDEILNAYDDYEDQIEDFPGQLQEICDQFDFKIKSLAMMIGGGGGGDGGDDDDNGPKTQLCSRKILTMSNHEQSAPSQPTSVVRNTVMKGKEPEKERNDKLKEVKAQVNFEECSKTSRYSESKTMSTREYERRHRSRRSRSPRPIVFSKKTRPVKITETKLERKRRRRVQEIEKQRKKVCSHGQAITIDTPTKSTQKHSRKVEIAKAGIGNQDQRRGSQVQRRTTYLSRGVWFDDLPAESIENYDDLKKVFLKNYLRQKKYIKDPIELHNIKQRDGESTEDFVRRYKLESRDVKGAPECMRIFGFMHGITNPELIKQLRDKIPKTMDEMMGVTTSFLRGEVAASNHERKKSALPPMTTPVEKRNHTKFYEFHGEVGHNTEECMHLKKQIEEMLKAGKLSHLIKELKQNSGKEQPKMAKKGDTSRKDKALAILMAKSQKIVSSSINGSQNAKNPGRRKNNYSKKQQVGSVGMHAGFQTKKDFPGSQTNDGRNNQGGNKPRISGTNSNDRFHSHRRGPQQVMSPASAQLRHFFLEARGHDRCTKTHCKTSPEYTGGMPPDFKDINKACPKDGYTLPEINWKVESPCGFPFKFFMDAYKGYHQIKMAKEDEEKTSLITSQGIFCYTKMPFDLRNAGATYQRLVDKAFHKQSDRNLKVRGLSEYSDGNGRRTPRTMDLVYEWIIPHRWCRGMTNTHKPIRDGIHLCSEIQLSTFSKLTTMDPRGDIMVLTSPPRRSLMPVSFGPPSTRMPTSLSKTMTRANDKENFHNVKRYLKTPSNFVKSLTFGALTLWTRSRLQEGTNIFSWPSIICRNSLKRKGSPPMTPELFASSLNLSMPDLVPLELS